MLYLLRRYRRVGTALAWAGLWLLFWTAPGQTQTGPIPEAVLWTEDFTDGIPSTWTVHDDAGTGVTWTNLTGAQLRNNYTGGQGDAAAASSDAAGMGPFDTALETPSFALPQGLTATLSYRANFQAMIHHDHLDLDVSADGGVSWTTLLSWNEDHGGFHSLPGEHVTVDLSAYLGQADLRFRWRYYDLRPNAWDHYVQVDDVAVNVQGHDLQLTRRSDPPTAPPGAPVTYTLLYTNAGAPIAEGLVLHIEPASCLTDVRVVESQAPVTPVLGLVWNVAPLRPGAHGVLTMSGVVRTGTAGNQAFTGTATISVPAEATAFDNHVALPLSVLNVPPVAQSDHVTTMEDTVIAVTVLDNDTDANADALTLTAVGQPQHGTAVVTGSQVFYQPNRDYTGLDVFTYTVVDPAGLPATGGISVTVLPVNDAPTLVPPADLVLYPGQVASVPFTVTDVDTPPAALQVTATVANKSVLPPGHLALSQTGTPWSLTLTATRGTLGETPVHLTASDGELRTQGTFHVRVTHASVYLPLLFRAYDARPDLQIQALAVEPADPNALTVTVINRGARPARNFWVDLYLDPETPPEVNQPWTELCYPYGAAWFVESLAPGETLTLTISDAHYQTDQSRWPDAYPAGDHALWAYADSWGYPQPWGGVRERDEDNNRYGPVTLSVTGALSDEEPEHTCEPIPSRPRYPEGGEP